MTIGANELKTKGVGILASLLGTLDEVFISVRSKTKYVVVDVERYEYLRECELEQALRETQEDMAKGRYDTQDIDEHMKALKDAL